MFKIRLGAFLFFISISGIVSGQEDINRYLDKIRVYKKTHSSLSTPVDNSYDYVEGTPYLFPDFQDGEILTKDSMLYQGEIRYDLFADEMEYKVNGVVYWISFKDSIDEINLNGKTFIYIGPSQGEKGGYYEQLLKGPCQLLEKYIVSYLPAEKPRPFEEQKSDRFIRDQDLYYLRKTGTPVKLITNKKSILNYFGDKSSEMATFMKKNHISLKKKNDLKKLVEYYNNL